MVVDKFGIPIKEGDVVLYAALTRKTAHLRTYKVTKVVERQKGGGYFVGRGLYKQWGSKEPVAKSFRFNGKYAVVIPYKETVND